MSNISTAFDQIKLRMQTLFPEASGWVQMANPYEPEQNTLAVMNKGWGIALGPGTNTNRNLSCKLSVQRSISVTIMRRRYANELDIDPKETAEKALLEDQYILIKDFEKAPALNNSTSGITRFQFASDAGIENVFAGEEAFIKLVTTYELEYFEHLEP